MEQAHSSAIAIDPQHDGILTDLELPFPHGDVILMR